VERALSADADPDAEQEAALDPGNTEDRHALAYLETILAGNPRGAVEQVLGAVDGGMSVKDAYLKVLLPAQREVGRMWHAGELNIAEEHVTTATTQQAMTLLCARSPRPSSREERTVVLACVAGNVHDIAIRATSDFFDMAGWRAISLGPDVPHEDIARSVQDFNADVVVLAATLDNHLRALRRAIETIRALEDGGAKIIVGGQVFERVPDLWRRIGADGCSPSIEATEPLGRRLTE
jgi:methanogenic corrinoid protein MtbC1